MGQHTMRFDIESLTALLRPDLAWRTLVTASAVLVSSLSQP